TETLVRRLSARHRSGSSGLWLKCLAALVHADRPAVAATATWARRREVECLAILRPPRSAALEAGRGHPPRRTAGRRLHPDLLVPLVLRLARGRHRERYQATVRR